MIEGKLLLWLKAFPLVTNYQWEKFYQDSVIPIAATLKPREMQMEGLSYHSLTLLGCVLEFVLWERIDKELHLLPVD